MGCGSSKNSSASEKNLKGKTLIGFVYEKGIVIGAECRVSNELDEKLQYPLTIRDNRSKMVSVSSRIIYVVQGVEKDCINMINRYQISDQFPDVGDEYSVSSVVETMYEYLDSLNNESKACGAIIGGWDASGPQVHRVFLKNKMVHKERVRLPAALGSGQTFALTLLQNGYKYQMSTTEATNLAFKVLYNETYYDKHSGGVLEVYQINESGWVKCPEKNALEAHTENYDLHHPKERKTLFLVVDARIQPVISANDIADHFKPYAKLFASHRVALYKSGDDHFYFHRLDRVRVST